MDDNRVKLFEKKPHFFEWGNNFLIPFLTTT